MKSNSLIQNQNIIFSYIKGYLKKHPYFCVIILHEYFRNLFPHDPHIKFKITNPKKRINDLQINLIKILKNLKILVFIKMILKIQIQKKNLRKKPEKFMADFGKESVAEPQEEQPTEEEVKS